MDFDFLKNGWINFVLVLQKFINNFKSANLHFENWEIFTLISDFYVLCTFHGYRKHEKNF